MLNYSYGINKTMFELLTMFYFTLVIYGHCVHISMNNWYEAKRVLLETFDLLNYFWQIFLLGEFNPNQMYPLGEIIPEEIC